MAGLSYWTGLVSVVLLAGCGGAAKSPLGDGTTPDSGGAPTPDASVPSGSDDSGVVTPPPSDDAGQPPSDDSGGGSAPRNATCTPLSEQTGTAVNTTHGRLDGTLVYVLPVGGSSKCNGDSSHVHLQIEVSGSVYDVAVDVGQTGDEVGMYQENLAVPGGAWAEGWHSADSLTYSSIGVTSSELPTSTPATIASQVESLLASTTKISIFCEGYTPGDNGCHDVHYEDGNGKDGAIILDPTAATSPVLFFRFSADSF
jgi:hypothetical protein